MSRPTAKKRSEIDSKTQIEQGVAGVAAAFDALLLAVRGNSVPLTTEQVDGIGRFMSGLVERTVSALAAANASAKATSFSLDAIPELEAFKVPAAHVTGLREGLRQIERGEIVSEAELDAVLAPELRPRQLVRVAPPAPPATTSVPQFSPVELRALPRPLGRVADDAEDGSAGEILTGRPIFGAPKHRPDNDEATFISDEK